MGKLLDERMSSLGGTRFYDVGFADDAVGYAVNVWCVAEPVYMGS